jgi:hypothetical protein
MRQSHRRRALIPSVEGLEGKLLLSAVPVAGEYQAETPGAENLKVRLTTDRRSYRAGQPVRITLRETNVGDEPIGLGASPLYAVSVVDATGTQHWKAWGPEFQATMIKYLPPGQSRTTTVVWDAHPGAHAGQTRMMMPLTGDFEIHGSLDGVDAGVAKIRLLGRGNVVPPRVRSV